MRKYAVEFVGTFFLVTTVCGAVLSKADLAPLAIGAVLTAMVFAGGHISGAHYNPAVTVAVVLRGRLDARDVLPYMTAQVLGATAAALISRLVFDVARPAPFQVSGRHLLAAVVVELIVTFALAFVVLNVATSSHHPNNSFYGLAIGLTVMAGAITVGPVSGGVFNPAVAVGVSIAGIMSWVMLPAYVFTTLAGGALAAAAFRALNPSDVAPLSKTATSPDPGTPEVPVKSRKAMARSRS